MIFIPDFVQRFLRYLDLSFKLLHRNCAKLEI